MLLVAATASPETRVGLSIAGTVAVFAMCAVLAIWQGYLLIRWGQTLGKRLVKIRIVREEDGGLPGFGRVIGVRVIVNGILAVWMAYALIDVLFIFGNSRRCIHDRIAGTKVVNA